MVFEGVKYVGDNFKNRNSSTVFACGATTGNARIKWGLPLDSARQIGPETILMGFLRREEST
jgi:hypothetical protein